MIILIKLNIDLLAMIFRQKPLSKPLGSNLGFFEKKRNN